jgi:LysM domain./Sporulation related domain.
VTQPLSAIQNPSSPDATSQLGEGISSVFTPLEKPGAEARGKDSGAFSHGVNALGESLLTGFTPTTPQDKPLEAFPQTSADAFDKLNATLSASNDAENGSPAGRQAGENVLKENKALTLVDAERKGEDLESNQQSPSAPAAAQASTAAGKTELGTLGTLINHSDAQLSEQQTATSPKVTVQPGDNLTEIALQHYPNKERSGIKAILKSNPQIENRDLIYPGQVLALPEIEPKAEARQESDKKTETTFGVQICTLFNASSAFAEAYVTELKQKGYSAYSAETKTKNDKIIYKIFIGNYRTKEEAEIAAMNFQKNEGKPDVIIKPEIAQSPESKKEEK